MYLFVQGVSVVQGVLVVQGLFRVCWVFCCSLSSVRFLVVESF